MLNMLIAYDADGNIVGTLDYLMARDENGDVLGLIDFAAHEAAGGKLRDIWDVEGAAGSATWPEWIGARAHDFKVELDPASKRVLALVHKKSGLRRERAAVEGTIARRIAEADEGEPADIRDVVGGPDRPLLLDEDGRTQPRPRVTRPNLPVLPNPRQPERQ